MGWRWSPAARPGLWALCLAAAIAGTNDGARAFGSGKAGGGGRFGLFDSRGNPIPAEDGRITLPLERRGFCLRAARRQAEAFDALLRALRNGRIEGISPLPPTFDAGPTGSAVREENLHVNISRKTIPVDDRRDDWTNALPQTIRSEETSGRSFTEAMWLPFERQDIPWDLWNI